MTRYLHQGWYETFLPLRIDGEPAARVWLEMSALVPLLRQLDQLYGSADEPYCRDPAQRRDAEAALATLLVALVAERPGVLRRACLPARAAAALSGRYGVRRVALPLAAPPWIDLVDVEPADLAPLLAELFDAATDRSAI